MSASNVLWNETLYPDWVYVARGFGNNSVLAQIPSGVRIGNAMAGVW